MSTIAHDDIGSMRTFSALVAKFPPRLVRSQAALQTLYRGIDALMSVDSPSRDQSEYLELLTMIAEQYESRESPTPDVSPAKMLTHLIEARGVKQSAVAKSTGIGRSTLSDVLAGRRDLSRENIRRLAKYFHVSPAVFL